MCIGPEMLVGNLVLFDSLILWSVSRIKTFLSKVPDLFQVMKFETEDCQS